MSCQECDRLKRLLLESFVFADRSQTAMRCYLFTHLAPASVSDLDAYLSLEADERKATDQRHRVYLELVHHRNSHGSGADDSARAISSQGARPI